MNRCSRCGTEIPTGAQFCLRCGRDVSRPSGRTHGDHQEGGETTSTGTQVSLIDTLRQATLGEYEILCELGRGGMASVFLGHEIALDRKVAIKVIFPALLEINPGIAERFEREARTAASLSHPHIIPVYAVKESGQLTYLSMKYVAGRPLDSVIRDVGPIPVPMAQTILNQVGGALGYAHRHGVVHRDIKPANIMLDEDGWTVVMDFGIAKVAEAEALTLTGGTVGTPTYMSPEQCLGLKVTPAADQYSLGVVAYEMITGKQLFEGTSAMTIMYEHCNTPPPPVLDARPDCPEDLATAIMRMLAKKPEDRWATIEDAVAAIGIASQIDHELVRTKMLTLAQSGEAYALLEKFHTPSSPAPHSKVLSQAARGEAPAAQLPPTLIRQLKAGRKLAWSLPVVIVAAAAVWYMIGQRRAGDITPLQPAPSEQGAGGSIAALSLAPVPASVRVGQTVQLSATAQDFSGNAVAGADITWVSGNPAVASVSANGLVTALAEGPAQLTVRSGEQSTSVTISVISAADRGPRQPATVARVASMTVTPTSATTEVGNTIKLTALPRDAEGAALPDRPVTWASSNAEIAMVSPDGSVTGVGEGTARLTATSDDHSGFATVTVTPVSVSSMTVAPPAGSLTVGATLRLAATPRDASGNPLAGRSAVWASSDPGIATVSTTGLVTGVAAGSASITATSGVAAAAARITVEAAPPPGLPNTREQIRQVIEAYARAIESRDLRELRRAYPGMTGEQERAWRSFFREVRELTVTLDVVEVDASGDTARARVEAIYEFRTARSERQTFTFTATLQRTASGWQLSSVQ